MKGNKMRYEKEEGTLMKKPATTLTSMLLICSVLSGCSGRSGNGGNGKIIKETAPTKEIVVVENPNAAIYNLSADSDAPVTSQEDMDKAYCEFIFDLMGECAKTSRGENIVISPDSILFSLNLAAAGASGDTLDQMMGTMFPEMKREDAFGYTVNRKISLCGETFQTADSVWINEDRADTIYGDYKDYVSDFFAADMKLIPFNDAGVNTINRWIVDKTGGALKEMVDELDDNEVLALINAVSFSSDWAEPYRDYQISQGVPFYGAKGNKQKATSMYSELKGYLKNDNASGFLKNYQDDQFAFITILPDDPDADIYTFMEEMTAEDYMEFWNSYDADQKVRTSLPAFREEYEADLKNALIDMGMDLPFDQDRADFSNLSPSPLYISTVNHKTCIDLNKDGTYAAAATEIRVAQGAAQPDPEIPEVFCERPFAYAIVDKASGLPVFLGIIANMEDID